MNKNGQLAVDLVDAWRLIKGVNDNECVGSRMGKGEGDGSMFVCMFVCGWHVCITLSIF